MFHIVGCIDISFNAVNDDTSAGYHVLGRNCVVVVCPEEADVLAGSAESLDGSVVSTALDN